MKRAGAIHLLLLLLTLWSTTITAACAECCESDSHEHGFASQCSEEPAPEPACAICAAAQSRGECVSFLSTAKAIHHAFVSAVAFVTGLAPPAVSVSQFSSPSPPHPFVLFELRTVVLVV